MSVNYKEIASRPINFGNDKFYILFLKQLFEEVLDNADKWPKVMKYIDGCGFSITDNPFSRQSRSLIRRITLSVRQ